MISQRRTFIVHCLLSTLACAVTALKCTKLVTIDGEPAMDKLILTEGLYVVNTTLPTNSTEIRELVTLLEDSNGMEFDKEGFTVSLQPKDIKRVSYTWSTPSLNMLILILYPCM